MNIVRSWSKNVLPIELEIQIKSQTTNHHKDYLWSCLVASCISTITSSICRLRIFFFCVLLYLFAFFSPRFYRVCFIWSHLLHLSIQLYYYCLARTHSVQKVWNRISFRFQLEKIFLMGGKVKWISSFTTWTRFAIHSTHTHIVVTSFFIAWVIQYVFYFFTLHSPNLVKPVSHTRIATLRIVV